VKSHDMMQREIGSSGLRASAIGLGTWAIGGWMWGGTDEQQSIAAIQASIDEGVSLIDTAPAYGQGRAEEIVGQAIKGRRDKVVLATKCGLVWHTTKGTHFFDYDGKPVHRYLGANSIVHEVEQSLKRLGTDHIDLYITHWQDRTTPISETMEALQKLKEQGKIRAIGASNVSPDELEAYLAAGGPDALQEEYSMIKREIETALLPACRSVVSISRLIMLYSSCRASGPPAASTTSRCSAIPRWRSACCRDASDRTGSSRATTFGARTPAFPSPTGRRSRR
jgi:methylglyoxal reductase